MQTSRDLDAHKRYYASLSRVARGLEDEKATEVLPAILEHLDGRIDAIRKDQKRIREMFPGFEGWDGLDA